MDLFDILLVRKLVGEVNQETIDAEIAEITKELENKASKDYVDTAIENIPVMTSEDLAQIIK